MRAQQWKARANRSIRWSTGLVPGVLDLTPDRFPDLFGERRPSRRRLVVIDANVWEQYGRRIVALLDRYKIEHDAPVILPGGEAAKDRESVERLLAAMHHGGVPRFGEPVIGWGGGVLHDVLGVAASEHRRGVEFEYFATTLLCAVDAMFALKCAVSELWKNSTGAYHPACRSWADPAFFATLPAEEIREGTAEIIKWAVAGDPTLFRLLEKHGSRVVSEKYQSDDPATQAILARTIRGMLRELARNPYELVTARRSYIGHGVSPGFEPMVRHGQAVVLDLLLTTMIAWRQGLIRKAQRDRIVRLVASVGLSVWHPVVDDIDGMMRALAETARHRGGRQLIPAPVGHRGKVIPLPIGRSVTYLELGVTEIERARDDLLEHVA